ncbi:S8 family serine peptidase [Colwellia psychrerythraea]|uniref:Subtilisin, Xanthomonalisin n=1 Tax=Colwellia psychrerythraea TaxID=28229 RepID=A0A099K9R4_COLPS|nr:Subtilisin, Xanthomonalisin [Colwellia psychrerythraea]
MNNGKFKLSMLAAAIALPLVTLSLNAQPIIKEEQRFIVTFKADKALKSNASMSFAQGLQVNALFDQAAANVDAQIVKRLPASNAMAVILTPSQQAALAKDTSIQSIEVDPKRYLLAESTPYGITMVQALQLSDSGSVNQKVCIMDTGYTLSHADLPSSGVTGDDGYGSNNTGNWYNDGNGHGTHVAGTIAAIGSNNQGVVGVNPSGKLGLHIVKVFNDSGSWAYGSDLIEAVSQCKAAGATVISMSLGGSASSTAEQTAFDSAFASGILNVAAAGNDGNSSMSYPASYGSVMSVAAVDSSGSVANFSQYNSQVEIAAPGVGVNSTYNDGGYKSLSGTSMAAPHVSGVAALVWGNNPNCTVQQLRNGLNASAQDKGSSGRDNYYGYGIVKAKDADSYLKNVCGTPPPNYAPEADFSSNVNGLTVTLTDKSTDDTSVTSHNWSFGDGSSSSASNPSHTYSADGSYQVSLTVSDAQGLTDSKTATVTVADGIIIGDCAPTWSASTNYQIGDKVSHGGYEYESTWWSTGASPAIYSNVWKKLAECDGTSIPDENQAPVSSFTYNATALSVSFNNTATDDKAVSSYSWSFGDGSSSTNDNPSYTYNAPGSYQVSLTVYDAEGLSHSSSQTVTLSDDSNNQGCDGLAAWSVSTSYAVGDKVSHNGHKYDAIWWSTGASPAVFSNVWSKAGTCQ